jgi:hypothetical protein
MGQNMTSLTEYLSQTQRGLYSRVFGADFLQKANYLSVANTTFNQTYGRKVWDAMNNRTVFWNALKKVAWGPTAGWVLRTERYITGPRVRPVTETGALPTVDVSTYTPIYALPKIIAGDFGAPIKSIFVNTLEGGMGDIVAMELQALERDFVKEINQELLAGSAYRGLAGSSNTSIVVPAALGKHFKLGDVWYFTDDDNAPITPTAATGGTVTAQSAGTVTVDTMVNGGDSFDVGDVANVKSRAGLTSIDDICMEDNAAVCAVVAHSDVYNLTYGSGRTAAGYGAGAYVGYNSGSGRDLSLTMLDTCIQKCREKGGEPKLILMGHDQYFKLERLLNAHQRYMGQEEFQVGVGDERTLPGTRTGLILSTYMGIPILPDADCPKSADTGGNVLGSNVFVLDTDYLEVATALQTTYIENRDFFALDKMIVRGLIYMMAELRCTRIDVQSKIADLSA